ncbi:MAG: hypothetical protein K2Q25_06050 [Mycobacteriaceae bacterium]|nr:hypothetical protein [Mycobacteriaceae bacterium]
MVRATRKRKLAIIVVVVAVVMACAVLALGGRNTQAGTGPLVAVVSPAIPLNAQEIPNPLRGQYEDLLQPLFPQGNPAQQWYPPWPKSYDASLRLSWRQLQPTDPGTLGPDATDDRKYDFSAIDQALATSADRGMRLTLRVYAYSSCCDASYPNNTNIEIPDWLQAIPGTSVGYPGPPSGSGPGVTQIVPNFNDFNYLNNFGQLLAALGRRYDGDERLSVFEFSGYGDFSENHISYLRDVLGVPGPAPADSIAALGYYSQFRDQNITIASVKYLVAANVSAFPHTQLVVTPQNPEIVRELLTDDVTKKLAAPVGIRADCLGVYSPLQDWAESNGSHYVQAKDPVVAAFRRRLAQAPVITEWCQLPSGTTPRAYYEKGLRDIVKYHVSMTSSFNFPDRLSPITMDPKLYVLWAHANAVAGYRYTVEARPGSQSLRDKVATISITWTNYGAAAATEKWVPSYRLVDFAGKLIRTLPATVDLKSLIHDESDGRGGEQPIPATATESVAIELADLVPGHYTLQASVDWQQHKPNASHVVNYPAMQLARDGRDSTGAYPIASLNISRDTVLPADGK